MGKYLDMVRKFEESRQAEGRTELQPAISPAPSPLKNRYHKAAEAVMSDCLALDANWLADRFPGLWQRMVLIDNQLERLEQRNAEAAEYQALLEKLVETVKRARALFEQERQQGAVQ